MTKGTNRRSCELCSHTARIYCESDKASLCYDCDQKVHSANFLVAKHSRSLLCHRCQSPTPWIASGLNLGRAASVCVDCVEQNSSRRRLLEDENCHRLTDVVVDENCSVSDDREEDEVDDEMDGEDEEYWESDEEEEDDDEDEDAENQVVPWSTIPSPPAAVSSSTSEEFSSSRFSFECYNSSRKRKREDTNLDSEEDTGCSLERFNRKARKESDEATSVGYFCTTTRAQRIREQEAA